MTTPYSDVYDLFITAVKDWKLDALYASSLVDFETYLQRFLIDAVARFEDVCNQSLEKNDTTSLFTETLTQRNQLLLADLMIESWLNKEIKDIKQFNLHILDKGDFKIYSEAQNLKAKEDSLSQVRENNSQKISDYMWRSDDYGYLDDWIAGNFGV